MAEYTVHFSQVISVSVTVDAEDVEAAIEAAYEDVPSGICAQCSGWGRSWSRDDSGELMVDVVTDESGAEVFDEGEDWRRVRREGGVS